MADAPPIPDLTHVPAMPRLPGLGNTPQILTDPYHFHSAARARLGPVYRFNFLGRDGICLHGPDALGEVLLNREGRFSNALGWQLVEPLFGGGLLLRDGAEHREHRRLLTPAFRAEVMRHALGRIAAHMERGIADWPVGRPFRFFDAVRQLTRAIAADVFMGIAEPHEADRLGRAFLAMLDASAAPIRRPLPFTAMRRGQRARDELRRAFAALVEARRAGDGRDIFSELCRLTAEDGAPLDRDVLVDHFVFFLFAAFDTTTSTLSAMVDRLAQHPEWQEAMAAEIAELHGEITPEALETLEVTGRVLKESLRLMPPVPFIPRGLARETEIGGHRLPPGTPMTVCPGLVMLDPDIWSAPERFDPDRFRDDRAEDRAHPQAWAPFGGGAHKCLGMNFAVMEAKAFFACFLPRFRIAPRPPARWRRLPIPRPVDGLRITLRAA